MTDWMDDRERIAALVEDVMANWHDSVERVAGDARQKRYRLAESGR